MGYKRRIIRSLLNWKVDDSRKPLILRGARQVGKTTVVADFSKFYSQSILLNLELKKDAKVFNDYDDVKEIAEKLFLDHKLDYSKRSETLLFIDEIQELPKAIQLLRYFYEIIPELHVIAAGSLLEFAMRNVKSFPVGRIEYLYLNPMNFEEFLLASEENTLVEEFNKTPVRKIAHSILLKRFQQYVIVGGMPEVVKSFLKNESLTQLPKIYESIWTTYQNDVEKYAANDTERKVIKFLMESAHLYLDQRVKFQNFGNSNYKSREVGEAFRSLNDARVIQLIYPTTELEFPIKPNLKRSPRMHFLDTGLVNYTLGIQSEMIGVDDLSYAYKGAIIPHVITQELISIQEISYRKPNFWVREKTQSSAEVDLVYSYKGKIFPIEIKSGSAGKLRSLHQFVEESSHPYAIRVYGGEFRIEENKTPKGKAYLLMNMPYYLGAKIPEYIEYFISNYKL